LYIADIVVVFFAIKPKPIPLTLPAARLDCLIRSVINTVVKRGKNILKTLQNVYQYAT
jgi:hypothetical protein